MKKKRKESCAQFTGGDLRLAMKNAFVFGYIAGTHDSDGDFSDELKEALEGYLIAQTLKETDPEDVETVKMISAHNLAVSMEASMAIKKIRKDLEENK